MVNHHMSHSSTFSLVKFLMVPLRGSLLMTIQRLPNNLLAEFYDLTTFGSHRYLLKRKAGEDHPVFKVTKNDTNWKRRFFFVRRDSIPDGKDLPKEWATHGRIEDPRRITISLVSYNEDH